MSPGEYEAIVEAVENALHRVERSLRKRDPDPNLHRVEAFLYRACLVLKNDMKPQ